MPSKLVDMVVEISYKFAFTDLIERREETGELALFEDRKYLASSDSADI